MENSMEERAWYQDLPGGARRVAARALCQIDEAYGLGSGTEFIEPYFYHNGSHTRMACDDLAVVKDALGLTRDEFAAAEMAMASHDIYKTFDRTAGLDEVESAEWLEQQMHELQCISSAMMKAAKLAVIGTTPRFSEGSIVQKAVEQRYPTKRAEQIAHAVAGADVGRLFTPEGPLLAHRLYQEMQAAKGARAESLEELVPFQDSQIEFLVNYSYPSRDIENALATHKSAVIRHLGVLSRRLEQGSIESWRELEAVDRDFILSNRLA